MLLDLLLNLTVGIGSPGEIWNAILEDFRNIHEPAALAAFGQVVMIDLLLAADNAIVVGALAAGLPAHQRRMVILIGIIAALVLRIFFALIVTQLLQVVGLILAGGLLLLWVSWRMWREIRHDAPT
nr:TerC family protein [Pseudomonadota bacterium]